MNNLSWLLYLADVCGNVGFIFGAMSIISIVAFALWAVFGVIMLDEHPDKDDWKKWRRVGGWAILPLFLFSNIVGSLVPSKDTVYLIIASEMGEDAAKTETGKKAIAALNRYLDNMGTEEKEE